MLVWWFKVKSFSLFNHSGELLKNELSESVDQTGQKRKAEDGPDEPKRRKLAAGKSTIYRA